MHPNRIPLIAGNWKMNHGGASGVDLAAAVSRAAAVLSRVEVVVAPPFTALAAVAQTCSEVAVPTRRPPIGIAAQNLYPADNGAFTGEVSAPMLVESGCSWVILGHSERRAIFGEADDFVARKLAAATAAHLHSIVCVGETLDERSAGKTLDVVLGQLRALLPGLALAGGAAVVAYEPVWAIGTGKVATPSDAQAVHRAIRETLAGASTQLAARTRILYGGSVKADNARELLAESDLDGALVGGASLDATAFEAILRAAHELASPPATA